MGRTNHKRTLARGSADHIGRHLVPLTDMFHRRIFAELAQHGFDDQRFGYQAVFINIDDDGSTLTELAARAKISKQAMHELVNELEDRGYVERIPSPTDGRSKLIRTTDRGERSIETAWDAIAEIEREWTAILGSTEMRRLRSSLEKLYAYYKDRDASDA